MQYAYSSKDVSIDPLVYTFGIYIIDAKGWGDNNFPIWDEVSLLSSKAKNAGDAARRRGFLTRLGDKMASIKRGSCCFSIPKSILADSSVPHEWDKEKEKKLLKGSYLYDSEEQTKEYIIHDDGRKVAGSNLSSGQQEIIPLIASLKEIMAHGLPRKENLFIEEPEAHLYPDNQKIVTELILSTWHQ